MNTGCILYAEDDSNDAFFLQRAFQKEDIPNPLQIVGDGQEAMDYLAGVGAFADHKLYPLPCLVLLDLKMPRRTGLEVLEWIRQQPEMKCLTVIIFSASDQERDITESYRLGANSFVVKPSSVKERAEFVRTIKEYWLRFHRPAIVCREQKRAENPQNKTS